MKSLYLLMLGFALNSHASEELPCKLNFLIGSFLQDVGDEKLNTAFVNILIAKGYVVSKVTSDVDQILGVENEYLIKNKEKAEKLNDKIFLEVTTGCTSKGTLNIMGFKSGLAWSCIGAYNKFYMTAVSGTDVFTPKNIDTYLVDMKDPQKKFKSLEEGQSHVVSIFAKQVPSCADIRKKLPKIQTENINEVVNKIVDDSDRKYLKEPSPNISSGVVLPVQSESKEAIQK